jgi:beta-galactosidase
MAIGGRDHFKHMPMKARVGVSRALINQNVPFEYVTATDLRGGLAGRYKIVYLPAAIALDSAVLKILREYVSIGGRLVLDMPGAWYDEYGRVLSTDHGTDFERTFGCLIRDFQYSSNVPRSLHGHRLQGFVVDLAPTHAKTLTTYDNNQPAITEARTGEGTAVVLGYEASLMCFRPGQELAEGWLARYVLGPYHSPYSCTGAIVYRLAGPAADHYFLINDGPAKTVELDTRDYRYQGVQDAVSEERLALRVPIALPPYSGRWLRFEK